MVTELDYRPDSLVVGDALSALVFLLFRHIFRLDLHTQSSAHCHVDPVFERDFPACLMVRGGADVAGHCYCREEIGGPPLHVDPLEGIGIVAYPEFVEVAQKSVIRPCASAGTELDCEVRIFLPHPSAHILKPPVIFNVNVALAVCRKIR